MTSDFFAAGISSYGIRDLRIFVPYIPFFTNVLDTPTAYKRMTRMVSTDNAYWLFKLIGHFVEAHYSAFKHDNNAYLTEMQSR